jgi:hypothetical protein
MFFRVLSGKDNDMPICDSILRVSLVSYFVANKMFGTLLVTKKRRVY